MGPLAALDDVCRRFCGRGGHDDACLTLRRVLCDAGHASGAIQRVRAAHPVSESHRCGARLAAPVDPPPGPASPPIWCALPDDGHDRHRTYDGRWLDLFSRPIEERPPVITYRCEACGTSGKTPAPCPTLAAIEESQ